MNWPRIILDGLSMSLLFNSVVGVGFLLFPQAYSTMFPKEIKEAAAPFVDRTEVRKMKLILYPLYLLLFLYRLPCVRRLRSPCSVLHGSVPFEAIIDRRDYTLGRLVPDSCHGSIPGLFPSRRNRPDQGIFTWTHTSATLVLGVFRTVRLCLGAHRGSRINKCAGNWLDQHR